MFYRTGCGNLGNNGNVQGRFEPDISSGNFNVVEKGSQTGQSGHNGFGDFKFDEYAHGESYSNTYGTFYPGIEAAGNFLGYEITYVFLTTIVPSSGTGYPTQDNIVNMTVSYPSVNFSSTSDEFYIAISQTSTAISASFSIVSSSGTYLKTWTESQSYSGVSNPPPYPMYNVNLAISGLENTGYANVYSNTDFQMETVTHYVTDYTGHTQVSWTGGNALKTSPCVSYYTDDEGGSASYTWQASGTTSTEAYQYMTISGSGSPPYPQRVGVNVTASQNP